MKKTTGRLIDADDFLEKMKKTSRYFDVKFDVMEQPTAYDVDAVIAELEQHGETISVKQAIEAVLNGIRS